MPDPIDPNGAPPSTPSQASLPCPEGSPESPCTDGNAENQPEAAGNPSFRTTRTYSRTEEVSFWARREEMDKGKPYAGIGGVAIGIQHQNWETSHGDTSSTDGVHVDMPLIWSRLSLPFVYPSLTVEANLGFPNVAVSAGVGPGLHFILPGVFQLYGKLMIDGQAASMDNGSGAGVSVSAVGGGQILFGYFEMRFPVAGTGNLQASSGFSAGLRLGF